VKSSYLTARGLRGYLAGAAAARAGDEMSGPALLLLGFAVTGRPGTGSGLLASVTIAGAAGGPVFGALLDRSRRPDRVLAWTLAAYALGLVAVQAAVGQLPTPAVVLIALTAGLFNPAVTGGWTAQLPRIVTGRELDRGSALDALTFNAASLAGPALAAVIAAGLGARTAVLTAAALVALAVPSACSLSRYRPSPARSAVPGQPRRPAPHGMTLHQMTLHRQMAAGFAAITTCRPLLRATVTSAVSYTGIGMLLVCCPVLGAQRLGAPARGALLISAIAIASLAANAILVRRPGRGQPDVRVFASTLVIGVSMAAAALAPGWLTLAAVALAGAGEGPQLTALFAVRHRETPAHMRGQVYTTAASLKIAGLAAGAAFAGPLAGRSVTACLLAAVATELCAAAAYLLAGVTRPGQRGSAQEGQQLGSEPGGIIQPRVVTCARLYREFPAGEEPGRLGGEFGGGADLDFARIHHDRCGDLGQPGPGGRRVERSRSVETGLHRPGPFAESHPGMRPRGVVPAAVEEGHVAQAGLRRVVTGLCRLYRGLRLLVPGLRGPPPHRRLLLRIGEVQPQRLRPRAKQHQVIDPLRVGGRVPQGHAPAR
jgi:MFS family permease